MTGVLRHIHVEKHGEDPPKNSAKVKDDPKIPYEQAFFIRCCVRHHDRPLSRPEESSPTPEDGASEGRYPVALVTEVRANSVNGVGKPPYHEHHARADDAERRAREVAHHREKTVERAVHDRAYTRVPGPCCPQTGQGVEHSGSGKSQNSHDGHLNVGAFEAITVL